MNRTDKIIHINSVEDLPTIEFINSISRDEKLKLVFSSSTEKHREKFGEGLKEELKDFQIGVHTQEPIINIAKLITDQEIEENQNFFEQCAKDYKELSEKLIYQLAEKLKVDIKTKTPYEVFIRFYRDEKQTGNLENWNYYFHGFHCGFDNKITKQHIEVPIVFGQEFGDLDPSFFVSFIKSTEKYQPLPVNIYEDYYDGKKIIEKMVDLNKFERIHSNVGNHFGIVVKDRQKVYIKTYEELLAEQQPEKKRFNIWEFLKGKK